MSFGVGRRSQVAVAVARLVAIALIQPLTWEPPYTMGAALKRQKKKIIIMKAIQSCPPKNGKLEIFISHYPNVAICQHTFLL